MKKILSMLLTLTLLIGLLAGCGGNQNTGNQASNDANTTNQEQQDAADNTTENDAQNSDETGEETRTADPNKTSIVFGITASFVDFTDYIPDMMAEWGYDVGDPSARYLKNYGASGQSIEHLEEIQCQTAR